MSSVERPDVREAERRWVIVGVAVVAGLVLLQAVAGAVRVAATDEPSYLEQVQTCLVERATPYEPVVGDPIALSAGRGAVRTAVDGNAVTIVLGSSERDAERVYDAYVAVAPNEVAATLLDRRRKVVFLWDGEPSSSQREFVYLCTRDAQE